MTAETRSSVPASVERKLSENEVFALAMEHLQVMQELHRWPANIVVGLEAFILGFSQDIEIVKTHDSIAIMVGSHLKRIYSAELDSQPKKPGMLMFVRTLINLLCELKFLKSPQS